MLFVNVVAALSVVKPNGLCTNDFSNHACGAPHNCSIAARTLATS